MSDAQNFISLDGLTANIQVAKSLIDEYNVKLSTVKAHRSRIVEEYSEQRGAIYLSKAAMREELLRQIKEQEMIELQQLEAEFHAQSAPLEDERRSIQAKIDGLKCAIAPIRKIPAEILGNIFREVVGCDVSPWLLATISKSWRITSLTTPSLWSNLLVTKLDVRYSSSRRWTVDGESRYTYGNRMLCRTLDELAYFVEKSGAVPLDVLIDPNFTEAQHKVIQSLMGEPYSSRISSISLSDTKSKEEMAGWTIGADDRVNLSQTSQIHTLTVTVELSSALRKHSVWKSLRVLHLGYRIRCTDFNSVVSELGLIEKISGVPQPWPNEVTPNVTLEYIKSMTLSCPPEYLARLRLRRLEKLYWAGSSLSSTDPNYSGGEPHWNISFPNVVRFEASGAGDAFEAALQYLPNVQTAILISTRRQGVQDGWALEMLESLASFENMLCPRIRHLVVGNESFQISTSKTLAKPVIKCLIKTRVKLGIPLGHLTICWTRRSGKAAETIQYI